MRAIEHTLYATTLCLNEISHFLMYSRQGDLIEESTGETGLVGSHNYPVTSPV
jgi:hypothetical protein